MGLGSPTHHFVLGGPLPVHESSAGCRCHKTPRAPLPAPLFTYSLRISALFLVFAEHTGLDERLQDSYAARGGGRLDSRGQGPCGSALTREAPIFLPRRAAMISPQRHRDRRDNSQLISGDGRAPAPCPPPPLRSGAGSTRGQALRGEDLCKTNPIREKLEVGSVKCETNPIWPGPGGARTPAGERCETNPICRSRQQAGVGRLCETNPICRRRAGKTIVKAKGLGDATPQGGNCAKRTQFGGAVYRTEQIQFRGVCGRRNTHHSTMLSFHHSNPMPIVQNEPNSRQGGRRLWGLSLGPRPCGLRPSLAPLCKTNPIPGRAGWDGARGTRGGVIGRNKANWPPHRPDQRRRGR